MRLVLNDVEKWNELPFSEPILYLQFDNCGKNKNKVLIGFVTDLVRRGVFVKAKLGFLMVGHTHEDIDQFFSIISIHLKKETVVCPDQHSLRIEIPNAFLNPVDKPDVIVLDPSKMFDFNELYLSSIDEQISYHQEPHQYRIKQFNPATQKPECVLVHYKNWVESRFWLPSINSSPPNDSVDLIQQPTKRRKMSRGQLTAGQRAVQTRTTVPKDSEIESCLCTLERPANLHGLECNKKRHGVFEPIDDSISLNIQCHCYHTHVNKHQLMSAPETSTNNCSCYRTPLRIQKPHCF